MYTSWNLPLEIDMNRTIGDAAEIPNLAQMPNEGSLGLDGVIDPALMQSFPSAGNFRTDLLHQLFLGPVRTFFDRLPLESGQ
jgi:hypothetical protein